MKKRRLKKKMILALCLGVACSMPSVYASDVTLGQITKNESGTNAVIFGYQVPSGITSIDITNSSITTAVDNSNWSSSNAVANTYGFFTGATEVTLQGATEQNFPISVSAKGGTSTSGYAIALAYGINGFNTTMNGNTTIETKAAGGTISNITASGPQTLLADGITYGIIGSSTTINGNAAIETTAAGGTISDVTASVPVQANGIGYGIIGNTTINGNANIRVRATGGVVSNITAAMPRPIVATAFGIGITGGLITSGNATVEVTAIGGTAALGDTTTNANAQAMGIYNFGTTSINGNTVITVTATGGSAGLASASAFGIHNYSGTVTLGKNTTITAAADNSAYSLVAAGGTININQAEGHPYTVKLTGDVVAAMNYIPGPPTISGPPSPPVISTGTINLNLNNSSSFLRGNVINQGGTVNFTLANNAVWEPAYNNPLYSTTNNTISAFNLSGGIVDLTWDDKMRMTYRNLGVTALSGTGGTVKINTDVAGNTGDTVAIGTLSSATDLKVAVTYDRSLSTITQPTTFYPSSYTPASVTSGTEYLTLTGVTTESGAYSIRPNFSGTSLASLSISGSSNTKAAASAASGQANLMQTGVNHLRKRLGDLRDAPETEIGVWARVYTGEVTNDKYTQIESDYKGIQAGYDKSKQVNNGRTYIGGAFSYTKANDSFYRGSGDSKAYDGALYQTWVGNDGHYYDIIAKYGQLNSNYQVIDLNANYSKANYKTWTNSLSAEYGYRKQLRDGWYLEPQAEITFGHINGVNYTTSSGMEVRQDGIDRLTGRFGIGAGKKLTNGNHLYTSLSALHEFKGKENITADALSYNQDMSGTWYEFILGTTAKLSDHSNAYLNVEKLFGGDVSSNWQVNAGCRFSF